MVREQQSYWHFGPRVSVPLGGDESGLTVRIRDDIRKSVVFVGFRDETLKGGFSAAGTGFFIAYDNVGHFVTCAHVAEVLGDTGFVFRLNLVGGDSEVSDVDSFEWHFHPDKRVDLAVAPFRINFAKSGLDHSYLDELFTKSSLDHGFDVGIGDHCYTIGLYRFLPGTARNVPIVHVGHIALMAGEERIPIEFGGNGVSDVRLCDSHLVEGQGVHGISGSPVFVRSSFDHFSPPAQEGKFQNTRLPRSEVLLFGVWQSSYFVPPKDELEKGLTDYEKPHGGPPSGVSLGKGAVVPVAQLIEILESDKMKDMRAKLKAKVASSATSLSAGAVKAIDENPTHQEDFKSLLTAAAKTPPQDD